MWLAAGKWLAALSPGDKWDQLAAFLLFWLCVTAVVTPVWLLILWQQAVGEQDHLTAELKAAREMAAAAAARAGTAEQKVRELTDRLLPLEAEAQHYRAGFEGFLEMALALNQQLALLLRETTEEAVLTRFNQLCFQVAWFLASKLYGGPSPGKVVFVHFGRTTGVLAENPNEQTVAEVEKNIMQLPVVQSALRQGDLEFEDDALANPQKVRVPGTNWSPRGCAAIMVVPIIVSPGRQGVFGIYANTPHFFSDQRSRGVPTYLRTILEIGAARLCESEASPAASPAPAG